MAMRSSLCQQPASLTDILLRCSECGICVHGFCYGVTEYSTPWLCYACAAKQKYPTCMVCMLVCCFGECL